MRVFSQEIEQMQWAWSSVPSAQLLRYTHWRANKHTHTQTQTHANTHRETASSYIEVLSFPQGVCGHRDITLLRQQQAQNGVAEVVSEDCFAGGPRVPGRWTKSESLPPLPHQTTSIFSVRLCSTLCLCVCVCCVCMVACVCV